MQYRESFQAFAYDNIGPLPISVLVLFISSPNRLVHSTPYEIWRAPVFGWGKSGSSSPFRECGPAVRADHRPYHLQHDRRL